MKVHEYQAKEILRGYKIPVPAGGACATAAEAERLASTLGPTVVVKAQIHAGGRGKAGGVKVVKGAAAAGQAAAAMLGRPLVTRQTGAAGQVVGKVLVEEGVAISREFYLGIVVDRASERVVVMASTEGGVEIEEVAAREPGKILKEHADPLLGLMPWQARKLAFGLGLAGKEAGAAAALILALYRVFIDKDCSIAEVNPLVLTSGGAMIALDAKLAFDDNGLVRHPEVAALRDLAEEEPLEVEAAKYGLSYIKLDGSVGCMVNGAGLAMGTMDIIKHCGGEPANFLDVGGGASEETVCNAFRIILADPNVRAILVNIFGGIVRCDMVALGIIAAARSLGVKVPVVVRLRGTNAEEAARIIRESGLAFVPAEGLAEAAGKAVAAAKGGAR
jgi:succinyl-CoA synthetase beta subunit